MVGILTIGYGHALKAGESFPDGITEEQASELLRKDVAFAEHAVNTLVTVPLTQGQFDALVDFTYNLGSGTLERSTLLKILNAGDCRRVPAEFLKWVYAEGEIEPGLVTRRKAEVELWTA